MPYPTAGGPMYLHENCDQFNLNCALYNPALLFPKKSAVEEPPVLRCDFFQHTILSRPEGNPDLELHRR